MRTHITIFHRDNLPPQTRDACYGDSGGPFMVRDANNEQRWTVTGLVSWGKGCAKLVL